MVIVDLRLAIQEKEDWVKKYSRIKDNSKGYDSDDDDDDDKFWLVSWTNGHSAHGIYEVPRHSNQNCSRPHRCDDEEHFTEIYGWGVQNDYCNERFHEMNKDLKDYDLGPSQSKDELLRELERFKQDLTSRDELMLLPGTVIGYSLRTRKWGTLMASPPGTTLWRRQPATNEAY